MLLFLSNWNLSAKSVRNVRVVEYDIRGVKVTQAASNVFIPQNSVEGDGNRRADKSRDKGDKLLNPFSNTQEAAGISLVPVRSSEPRL